MRGAARGIPWQDDSAPHRVRYKVLGLNPGTEGDRRCYLPDVEAAKLEFHKRRSGPAAKGAPSVAPPPQGGASSGDRGADSAAVRGGWLSRSAAAAPAGRHAQIGGGQL